MQFLFDFIFLLVVVYAFGTLLSAAFCSSLAKSISFAPLLSFGCLFLISFIRCEMGLSTSWKGIVLPFCVLSLIVFLLGRLIKKKRRASDTREDYCDIVDCKTLGLYVFVGAIVATFVYVRTLDSAASFFQGYDSYYHINTVRQYLNTGFYCSLPVTGYPNLWHCLTAITASFGAFAIPQAVNAFNFFLVAFVVPTSVYLFMDAVFWEDKAIVFIGAFATAMCNTFPWNYVSNGPVYALLIGWALLPISMALFAYLCESKKLSSFICMLGAFCASCLVLVVAHPSVIFAGIVILTPLGAHAAFASMRSRGFSCFISCIVAAVFLLCVLGFWVYCFRSPLFAGVVNFPRPAQTSLSQAISNAIVGSLSEAHSPQPVLMLLTFLGLLCVLKRPQQRWLAFSLCSAAFICIVSEGIDGYWRQFFCGFWYNDLNRLMGLYGFMLAVLSAPGLAVLLKAFPAIYQQLFGETRVVNFNELAICFCSLLLALVLLPSFSIPSGTYVTPFAYIRGKLYDYNDLSQSAFCYDSSEIAFTDKVKEIVGDSKVLNYPYDGSCFAYAISNLNTINRVWWVTDLDQSHPDALMRMKINQIFTDKDVQKACNQEDVSYVLLLDYGHPFGEGVFNYDHRVPEAWTGLTSITDSTAGLKLLLSEGDMRLYEIENQTSD
ncbi:DUF6541 family protein [Collinsella bouchesdurhonensis]|uniref:DUF6541 family protein n=1 Tax=Collinsella bouchesdurhonensis TaxID=1907654 RepID=UPI003F8A2877